MHRLIRYVPIVMLALTGASGADEAAPERVVSMNLCTDQLAMMLAGPGQLVSISALAHDPRSSVMAEQARAFPANHAGAEEVFLLAPDLVLAGAFTARPVVAMLRRLGIRVETVAPAYSLDDVRDRIAEVGAFMGRDDAADQLIIAFDRDLAGVQSRENNRLRAAIYAEQGYTSGPRSLAGAILNAAGFDNAARDAGMNSSGFLPLEQLVMLAPDLVILPTGQPGASRAGALLDHPAVKAFRGTGQTAPLTDAHWVCGTPHVLNAIAGLRTARDTLQEQSP